MTDSKEGVYGLNIGTYEEALEHVGKPTEPRYADATVNTDRGTRFAAAVQDPNPLWWDEDLARRLVGDPVVPPATLVSWVTNLDWKPDGTGGPGDALLTSVPMPGNSMINVSSEIEHFDHLRVGDRYHVVETVEDVSPEKTTRAGVGHFLTMVADYHRQDGTLVARQRNVMLRYWTEGTGPSGVETATGTTAADSNTEARDDR